MAPSVEFHTGVADLIAFACRLLRKAHRSGARVVVTAARPELDALDRALWTFEAQAFVPHLRWPAASEALAARTPIWLVDGALPTGAPSVLVNLGADAPAQPGTLERVIEVVGLDGDAVAAGRARWRHYEAWGAQPLHHAAR